MSEKITGYLLLILGLLIVAVSVFEIYQVFTGKQTPISVVKSSSVSVQLIPDSAPVEVLKASDIDRLTNLTLFYLLMSFIASAGFKVSSLGVQMLRPIEVKLSAKSNLSN